jgi:hypothetical protein
VDRVAGDGTTLISQLLAHAPLQGQHCLTVTDKRGKPREATLEIKVLPVVVHPPEYTTRASPELTLTVMEARERGPGKNAERIVWKLLTNLPVRSLRAAIEKLTWYAPRWEIGVSREGSFTQSVQVQSRPRDSSLMAREAPGRESKPVKPSDNMLCKKRAQRSRLQRTVNAEVASLHATPVAEPVDNVRRQQGPSERDLHRRSSPAGYQRRHGTKGERATGEVRGVRRRKLAVEAWPITVNGKWLGWLPDGGSGHSTEEPRAAKRVGREGPGPVGIPLGKERQG